MVSAKSYPVSRKMTSWPGFTRDARGRMDVWVMDDVAQIRSPTPRRAHRTISSAGAPASISFARLARSSRSAGAPRALEIPGSLEISGSSEISGSVDVSGSVEVIGQLRYQRIATERHGRSYGNASCHPAHEAPDLPRHNRGNKKGSHAQPQKLPRSRSSGFRGVEPPGPAPRRGFRGRRPPRQHRAAGPPPRSTP